MYWDFGEWAADKNIKMSKISIFLAFTMRKFINMSLRVVFLGNLCPSWSVFFTGIKFKKILSQVQCALLVEFHEYFMAK